MCLKNIHQERQSNNFSIEPGLTACFPRLFINKKVNSMEFNFSLA